jgi:hypothetical protein
MPALNMTARTAKKKLTGNENTRKGYTGYLLIMGALPQVAVSWA